MPDKPRKPTRSFTPSVKQAAISRLEVGEAPAAWVRHSQMGACRGADATCGVSLAAMSLIDAKASSGFEARSASGAA